MVRERVIVESGGSFVVEICFIFIVVIFIYCLIGWDILRSQLILKVKREGENVKKKRKKKVRVGREEGNGEEKKKYVNFGMFCVSKIQNFYLKIERRKVEKFYR